MSDYNGGNSITINVTGTGATTLGTVTVGTWNSTIIGPTYGGTGVNNGSSTITIGGNVTFSGAHTATLIVTGSTSVTLPTSGILATAQTANNAIGNAGLTPTINFNTNPTQTINWNVAASTIILTAPTYIGYYTLVGTNTFNGAVTLTWPVSNFVSPGGSRPQPTNGTSAKDTFVLYWDGTTWHSVTTSANES